MKKLLRKIYVKWLCWRGKAVDISSENGCPAAEKLSNFTPYTFTFRGREFCVSHNGQVGSNKNHFNRKGIL